MGEGGRGVEATATTANANGDLYGVSGRVGGGGVIGGGGEGLGEGGRGVEATTTTANAN